MDKKIQQEEKPKLRLRLTIVTPGKQLLWVITNQARDGKQRGSVVHKNIFRWRDLAWMKNVSFG